MPTGDFLLKGVLDLSQPEKELREFYAVQRKLLSQAVSGGQGATKTAALPRDVGSRIASPSAVAGYKSGDDAKRLAAQKRMIENQAKLVALQQKEAQIIAQNTGQSITKKDLGRVRTAGIAGLEDKFGGQLSNAQKQQFGRALNAQMTQMTTQLQGLVGAQLNTAFRDIANPLLAASKLPNASIRQVSTLSKESDTQAAYDSGEKKRRQPPKSSEEKIAIEEQNLVEALRRKIKSLNAQTRVLDNKRGPFTQAEQLLIDALRAKAAALGRQVAALAPNTSQVAANANVLPSNVSQPVAQSTKKPSKKNDALDIDIFDDDINEQAQAAEIVAGKAEITSAKIRTGVAEKKAAAALASSYDASIAAEEAAEAALLTAAQQEQKEAAARKAQSAQRTAQVGTAAQAATKSYLYSAEQSPIAERRANNAYATQGILAGKYVNQEPPTGFSESDFNTTQAAENKVARAYIQMAEIVELTAAGWLNDYVELKAAYAALTAKVNGLVSTTIINDPTLLNDTSRGRAESQVANKVIEANTASQIFADPKLQQQLIAAELELAGFTKQKSAMMARDLANDPAALAAEAENVLATRKLALARIRATNETQGALAADAQLEAATKLRAAQITKEAQLTPEGQAAILQRQENRLAANNIAAGNTKGGVFSRITKAAGYNRQGSGSLTEFFGGGALSTLKYGLPSLLLYGAATGIADTVREAEELQYNLARLEGQFEAVFAGQDFGPVRQQILDVAKNTGLAADEIANLQIQITGAFSSPDTAAELGYSDPQKLVQDQVESAARLAQTVGLPLEEITDGLTAASLAFGEDFERIGDVALSLEQESGVLAKETVAFIGDIAPVAKEAGYSVEEFSAIAAVAQQRSGRSGAALAESFGRVIPALTEQKDKLLELAAIEPSLGTDGFIDAIRSSDAKRILDEIGKSYENLSAEGQQKTITLLGGRREAQAIIPAISNQALIERYVKDAEASSGTLEERFQKVQETLTNTFQRVGEAVRQLGVELLEAGLADAFETAASAAKVFLAVLGPVVKLVGTLNNALGGIPTQILLGLAAYKLFARLLTKAPLDEKTGLPLVVGDKRAPRVSRFDREALRDRATYRPRFVDDYRSRRTGRVSFDPFLTKDPYYTRPGSQPIRTYGPPAPAILAPQKKLPAVLGSLRGSGANLLAGIGGGSVAAGAGLSGLAGLAALYGWANSQADKERKNLEDLRAEIDEGNEEVDFDVPGARESRVEELRAQAQEARDAFGGWSEMWSNAFGIMREDELLLAEAQSLDTTPEFREALKVLDQSTTLRQDIFKDFAPKLGKSTDALENRFRVFDALDGTIKEIDGKLAAVTPGNVKTPESFDARDTRYIEEIAEGIEVRTTDLDLGFLRAASQGDQGKDILLLAKNDKDAVEKYGSDAVEQAQLYVDFIFDLASTEGDYVEEINEIIDGLNAVTPLEESQLNAEEIRTAFDLGIIGFDEFNARLRAEIQKQISIKRGGEQTAATESEILKLEQELQQLESDLSSALVERQEKAIRIAEVLGASETDVGLVTIAGNLDLLNDPNFTDEDARLEAALAIIEQKKITDLKMAEAAGDTAEVNRILEQGVQIPPEVRAILYSESLRVNDDWIELSEAYNNAIDDVFGPVAKRLPDHLQSRKNPFEGIGSARELSEDVFGEVFDDVEGISEGLRDTLIEQAQYFSTELKSEELTGDQRKAMASNLEFVVSLMQFAGFAAGEINEILGEGLGGAAKRAIEGGLGKGGVLSNELPPAFAQVDPDEAQEEENRRAELERSLRQAELGRATALAGGNALRVAQLERAAALAETRILRGASVGEGKEFETQIEKDTAIIESETDAIKAAEAEANAALADITSGFELVATIAEINGDLVGAAVARLQAAQAQLAAAEGVSETNAGQQAVAQANEAIRQAAIDTRSKDFDLFAATLELEGDIVNAALTRVRQAEFNLAQQRGRGVKEAEALIALQQARQALGQARATERDALYGLFSVQVAGEDPVGQSKVALALAKEQQKYAKGTVEKANAQKAVIEAQRAVEDAMAEARYSVYTLRQAELDSMDNQIGSAQAAVELARIQLNDAISQGQGQGAINAARANLITTEKALTDTIIQEKLDDYKFLLDMGEITQSQYVRYLEALQSTLAPGTKQFKDLALTIKQLKDGISGDLQANLPTSLTLPTLYEVRRFNQTGDQAPSGAGIGYQDNRQVSVSIEINEASGDVAGQVVSVMNDVLGVSRNGYGIRRY